jgi:hypothetical protein
MAADLPIADRAFDADSRVLEPLAAAGKSTVIPPRSNRLTPRKFDRELYKERHLIENFFCKLKQFPAIATRYDKTARNFPGRHPPRRRYHLAQLTTRLVENHGYDARRNISNVKLRFRYTRRSTIGWRYLSTRQKNKPPPRIETAIAARIVWSSSQSQRGPS